MIQKIKNGFTMIEMLVVITIIGILIAILVPQVGNSQEKSRDITQQTHIQELASALIAYKLDYGEFPIITGDYFYSTTTNKYYTNNAEGGQEQKTFRGQISKLTTLKENKYISTIHKNPNNRKFTISDTNLGTIYDDVYSIYISNGNSFAIIAEMENESEGNCNINHDRLIELLGDNNPDMYDKAISELESYTIENNGTGNYYVYVYANTIE